MDGKRRGCGGAILADVDRLDTWLDAALVLLTLASAARYLEAHGLGDRAPAVLAGAVLLLAVHLLGRRTGRWGSGARDRLWCLGLVGIWAVLVLLAPSFAWLAVPLSFVALRVLPFPAAVTLIAAMAGTVVVTWTVMTGALDPTVVAGPVAVAALAVVAYRALDREASARTQLLAELQDAQQHLLDAQHTAGVLAERGRLSRELHDSVAQSLSSINMLLQAAEQSWRGNPDVARGHVAHAAATARGGLDEVRRVVRDLAPADLQPLGDAAALPAALRRTCEDALRGSGLRLEVHVDGAPVPVPADVATALLRTARGALANVVEHAQASAVAVSLTYQPDSVTLDVRDDGRGFRADRSRAGAGRGHGLAGIRSRAEQFGGALVVETDPGEGTAVAFSVPLPAAHAQR